MDPLRTFSANGIVPNMRLIFPTLSSTHRLNSMDEIYRFRTIDRLLGNRRPDDPGELESQAIYFAESSKLNDPMEATRDLVWRGDTIAWTNLFRHYLNCLHHIYFLLRVTDQDNLVGPGDIPINMRWDDPPSERYENLLDEIWSDLNQQFDLVRVAARLEALGRAARSAEVEGYLTFLHLHAIAAINRAHITNGLQDQSAVIVGGPSRLPDLLPRMFDLFGQIEDDGGFVEAGFEAMQQMMVKLRILSKMTVFRPSDSVPQQNSSFFFSDFPHAYVQELSRAVGPVWYAACFTESPSNTAQWGNYADGHKGACLIFAVGNDDHGPVLALHEVAQGGQDDKPTFRSSRATRKLFFERVRYVETLEEVDFFARISRMPEASARAVWFTDDEGNTSSVAAQMAPDADIAAWRDALWSEYHRDICTKTKEWEFEREHRLVNFTPLADTLPDDALTLTYDFSALKGIIFGINTPDHDKIAVIDLIKPKCKAAGRTEFDFRQAYYSWSTGQIESYPLNLDVTQ